MRIAVLGTGTVGRTLAGRLTELGHEVHAGTRSTGTYASAAAAGDLIVNATAGAASLEALAAVGADNLRGKVLLDVANPLVFDEADRGWRLPRTARPWPSGSSAPLRRRRW